MSRRFIAATLFAVLAFASVTPAQTRKSSTPAKPSTKTPPKASAKTPAKTPTKTQAKTPAKAATKPPAQAAASSKSPAGVVNISTQPGAAVWVDEVRRGTADAEGKLQLKLTPGRHSLRVRAAGFAERTLALLPAQGGALSVVREKQRGGA